MAGPDFPWSEIGKVQLAGYDWLGNCTGTLVAPDLVLTAAHCFSNSRTKKQVPVNAVHFRLGLKKDEHLAHAKAKCVALFGPLPDRENPLPAFMKGDAAVIRLETAVNGTAMNLARDAAGTVGTEVSLAGYAKEKPFWPLVHRSCRVIWNKSLIAGTDCIASPGQSGGPVMVAEDGETKIAGIAVASHEGKDAIIIPATRLKEFIASGPCPE